MKAWWHGLMAAVMVLVLANPLCGCDAPEPTSAAPESIGCCGDQAESQPENPEPTDNTLPGPCDCETAAHEGLPQAADTLAKPAVAPQQVEPRTSIFTTQQTWASDPLRLIQLHAPPLRHLYSIYRL